MKIIAAFAALYLVWGSTYLAIRFTVETLPPFLSAGLRFFLAGLIMYSVTRFKFQMVPQPVHWRSAVIIGALLMLGGNGCVVKAEQTIPSGLAALIIATTPLWMVLLQWLWLKEKRPSAQVFCGIAVGLLGVWCLVTRDFLHFDSGNIDERGIFLLLLASLSWSIGSVYSRKAPLPVSPFTATGMQMICGGVWLMLAGTFSGEWAQLNLEQVHAKSVWSLLYLLTFGSFVGFTAYIWLLKNAGITKTSTYAFVNPVVAVFLGWAFAGEQLTAQTFAGAAFIVAAVCMITLQRKTA